MSDRLAFTDVADGPFRAPDGWATHHNSAAGEEGFVVEGGSLTHRAGGKVQAASYLHGGSSLTVEAEFVFMSGGPRLGKDRGGVMVGWWATDFAARAKGWLPDSPCHLVITPTHWTFAVGFGGKLHDVAAGRFRRRLAANGETVHRAKVALDPTGDVARFDLPDGTSRVVTSSHIAPSAARQACFEVYQFNAARDTLAGFRSVRIGD